VKEPDFRPTVRLPANNRGVIELTKRALRAAGADRDFTTLFIQECFRQKKYADCLEIAKKYADIEVIEGATFEEILGGFYVPKS